MNLRQAAGAFVGNVGRKLGVQELGISEAIAGKAKAQPAPKTAPRQILGTQSRVPVIPAGPPAATQRTAGTYNQTALATPQPQPAYSGEPSSDGGGDGGGGESYDPLGGLRSAFSSMRSAYEGLLPTYDADYKTFETRTNDAITRAKNTLNTQNQEDEVRFGENLRNLLQSDKELRQRRQGVFSGLNALDSSAYQNEVQEGDQFLLESQQKLTSEKDKYRNERQNEYDTYEKNAVSKIAEYGNEIARAKQALRLAVANVNMEEAASIQERIDQLSAEARGIYDNMTNFKLSLAQLEDGGTKVINNLQRLNTMDFSNVFGQGLRNRLSAGMSRYGIPGGQPAGSGYIGSGRSNDEYLRQLGLIR